MKLDKICRTCLLEKANLRSLFEACIASMLMSCANIQVIEGDGLPNLICTQCILNLNKAYSFKQLCEKSDITIRNYLDVQSISIQTENIIDEVKSDLFNTNEVLQQTSLFQDIFNDATTHSLVETFTNQNVSTDLAETMQSLQTIAEQCLPESWESDGQIVPCNSQEASDNFNLGTLYKCQFCEDIFKDEWSLGDHIKNHTGQKYFCSNSTDLNKHLIDHPFLDAKTHLTPENQKNNIKCNVCDKHFSNSKYLKRHLKEVHFVDTGLVQESEKKYACNICGKRYRLNKLLMLHMRIHTGERPYNCEVCGRNFALYSCLHKHRNIHGGEKKYECNICGKKFYQSSGLNAHLRTHSGQKPYICNICGKGFSSNRNLDGHTRTHSGIKPYTCNFCQVAFASNSQLRKHSMIHTGEKPYPCWQCGRSFRRKETRDTHVRYHTGERPYSCNVCSKKYIAASHLRVSKQCKVHPPLTSEPLETMVSKYNISTIHLNEKGQEHMKTHSNDRKFDCAMCLRKFLDSKTLKSHIMTHTGQKPYSCRYCGKNFIQNSGLASHLKHCHNNQTQ